MSDKNLYDEIAKVAYELYEQCGCIHGHDIEHWFEAERIVITRLQSETEEKPSKVKTPRKAATKREPKAAVKKEKPKKSAVAAKKTAKPKD